MVIPSQHFRYLPKEPADDVWGVFVRDAGSALIPPGCAYPPEGHPQAYCFTWEEGRQFDEFQVIYIWSGEGVLETRRGGRCKISAGQAMLLFPQEWHRYQPNPTCGWGEAWVGFEGDYAAHLMRHFFRPENPIVSFREPTDMARLMDRLVDDAMDAERAFTRPMVAAGVLEMIARLHQAQRVAESSWKDTNIESARLDILMRTSEKIDWHAMAQRHGMSHATFRRRFKEVTGRSPLDYQIEIRLNQAVELLRHSGLTVSAIAELLGYTNVHFFSRQFKGRLGVTPKSIRERTRD